jgi:Uma2 family endonuclease
MATGPESKIRSDVGVALFFAGRITTATTTRPVATEEDLLRTPKGGQKHELVDGEIRLSPTGSRHGLVCVELVLRLGAFIKERHLGYLFDSSTAFRLPGGNVRLPDVAFVARGRFADEQVPEGFAYLAPDLAVEVLSPRDRTWDMYDKIGEYLDAGVPLVWVIDPKRRKAAVYKSVTDVRVLGHEDFLDGEDVVPGFRCRLADVID